MNFWFMSVFSRKKNPRVYKELIFASISFNTRAITVHLVEALKCRLGMKPPFKTSVCIYYWSPPALTKTLSPRAR